MNQRHQTFEQMNVPTCVINSEQHIVFWNKSATAVFGHDVQGVVGKPCWLVFQGSTPQGQTVCRPSCPLVSLIGTNKPILNFDMVVSGADGKVHQVQVSSQPCLTEDQQEVQLVHFLRPYPASQPTYHLYLLGSVYLQTVGGTIIDGPNWADPHLQATFIYLVLNQDHPVTRAELRRQIWPHLPTDEANRQITAVIEKLCHSLSIDPPESIIQENNGYKLHDAISIWVDIDEFDKLLAQAADVSNAKHKMLLLQQAVNLYSGDFLINLPFTKEWIGSWRTHFRQGYFAALQKLSALHEQAGDLESAQKVYLNALTAKPFFLENNQHFRHLFDANNTIPTQTLRQCKRLISLLQNELEFLLEEQCHQPLNDTDSSQNLP